MKSTVEIQGVGVVTVEENSNKIFISNKSKEDILFTYNKHTKEAILRHKFGLKSKSDIVKDILIEYCKNK